MVTSLATDTNSILQFTNLLNKCPMYTIDKEGDIQTLSNDENFKSILKDAVKDNIDIIHIYLNIIQTWNIWRHHRGPISHIMTYLSIWNQKSWKSSSNITPINQPSTKFGYGYWRNIQENSKIHNQKNHYRRYLSSYNYIKYIQPCWISQQCEG